MARMGDRLQGKVAIVVGAGQTPGDTIGNGRATAILFAREGAQVLLVDRDLASAEETEAMIRDEGGEATPFRADITIEDDCRSLANACVERYGRIDVVDNNVGIGGGDGGALRLEEDVWRRILDVNLTGMFLVCKHVLPVMREQHAGSIINISSIASIASAPQLAYKVSKAGVNALTHQLAIAHARHGVRVNAILPGLMDTPMAIEGISQALGIPKDELARRRDDQVPLGKKMGSAWDVAYAALFLACDESKFITGVLLPVDGGQSARIG
jgi:NAD(P)-dependent dehydrogenase (short-subunit alcohol dehydrogenase family)